jgi:uncharacterized protein (TIGR00725 family)
MTRDHRIRQVAVIGPGDDACTSENAHAAYAVGAGLAGLGLAVVTGGLGGVMAASCHGAHEAGGLTIGLLPGTDRHVANPWVRVVIPTGLGQARNTLVVRAGRCVIAIGQSWGTLSEIALALREGIPVASLDSWTPIDAATGTSPIIPVSSPAEVLAVVRRTLLS